MKMKTLTGEPAWWSRALTIPVLALIGAGVLMLGQQPVTVVGNAAVTSGQVAVTGTAAALGGGAAKNVCVKALNANVLTVYVGGSGVTTATGMELAASQAVCLPVNNSGNLYVIASSTGASVSWIATN